MTALHVDVQPGDGVVGRWARYLLVAPGPYDERALAPLVDLVRTAATDGATGRTLLQRVAAHIVATETDPVVAVVGPDEDGWVALATGDAAVIARAPDGEIVISGVGHPTWADGFLPAAVSQIEMGAADAEAPTGTFSFDLTEGVVPGAGMIVTTGIEAGAPLPADAVEREAAELAAVGVPSGEPPELRPEEPAAVEEAAEPEPPEPEAPEPEVEEESPDEPTDEQPETEAREVIHIDLASTGDVAPREALSVSRPGEKPEPVGESKILVTGINCKRGHFNHPEAAFCALCGISMLQQTQNPVQGPRPPLGILVFGDGATVSVDDVYVIGREPTRDPAVAGGAARAFMLDDPDQVLSRVHLAVTPTGWDVEVVDRGSANGTYVLRDADWERLEPGTPCPLESGMQVRLGNHQFVYEAHHRPRGTG